MESMKKHPPSTPSADDQEAAVVPPSRSESPPFPIAGLGASAGGLEALEQFLRHVPEDSGMAFVVVQHLDPTHKGIMPELLQRATGMEVFQVRDRMKVKPKAGFTLQLFATDLDRDAIDKARQGFYPANIAADVSAERLERFFVNEDGG